MPLIAIALISAGLLAYEVLLTRLLSIIQWHHFAYMVISIALLGYGASGTFLAFAQDRLRRRFASVFALCAVLFAVSAVTSFVVAQQLPFNALAVIWEPGQLLYLFLLYLFLTVPFACGATCIGLALVAFPSDIGHIYRSDMLGAGTGAIIGAAVGHPAAGVVIGGGIGALGGFAVGNAMQNQNAQQQQTQDQISQQQQEIEQQRRELEQMRQQAQTE